MKKIIQLTAVLLITLLTQSGAQQLPLFSQYMFNTFLINPAAAGLDGYTAVNLTAREQWLGVKDSPKTHILSGQTRLDAKNFITKLLNLPSGDKSTAGSGKVGLGAILYDDRTGIMDRTGFQFTYAYHLTMHEAGLSLGISAAMYQFTVNKSKIVLNPNEQDDNVVNGSDFTRFVPDFSFGAMYTTKDYYAGFAIMQLMQSSVQFSNSGMSDAYRLYRQYNIHGGYRYEINRDYVIQPSALVKISKLARPQLDLSAKVFFRNDYWAGLSFRTGSAFVLMAGVSVDQYSFGYAFDYNFSSISRRSLGTHEVMISVKFGERSPKYHWLHRL